MNLDYSDVPLNVTKIKAIMDVEEELTTAKTRLSGLLLVPIVKASSILVRRAVDSLPS